MGLKHYLAVSILTISMGCTKKVDNIEVDGKPHIVWTQPIIPAGAISASISMNPVIYKDKVVYNTEYDMFGEKAPLLFFNKKNGKLESTWSDYRNGMSLFIAEKSSQSGSYLFLRGEDDVDVVDLNTAKTAWSSRIDGGGTWIYTHNNKVYTAIANENLKTAGIISSISSDASWEDVFLFKSDTKRIPYFDSYGFGTMPNGDEFIVWKNRSFVLENNHYDTTELFAYNLTADSLMWRNTDLGMSSGIIPLKISGREIIGTVQDHVFAMDLLTGKLIWKVNVSKSVESTFYFGFYNGDVHIEGDKVYAMSTSDELVILHKHTGRILKVIQDIGLGFNDRFTYFEGKLFFTTGTLNIFDLATDELIFQSHESMGFDDIKSRIVIDEETRLMYFHNGREAFCVQMPAGI